MAELLQRGVRVLVYVGESCSLCSSRVAVMLSARRDIGAYDWVCNWVGNLAWTTALEWPGHRAFASSELREWTVDGERAGLTKREGVLTYATVDAAGHMVRLCWVEGK